MQLDKRIRVQLGKLAMLTMLARRETRKLCHKMPHSSFEILQKKKKQHDGQSRGGIPGTAQRMAGRLDAGRACPCFLEWLLSAMFQGPGD